MYQEIAQEKQEKKEKEWRQEAVSHFQGALKGLDGIYQKKIYPLEERRPVYFVSDGTQTFVAEEKQEELLAELYYIGAYGEYCVTPAKRQVCFLESGQPLGAGRHYYLRRGTRICLEGLSFLLA